MRSVPLSEEPALIVKVPRIQSPSLLKPH